MVAGLKKMVLTDTMAMRIVYLMDAPQTFYKRCHGLIVQSGATLDTVAKKADLRDASELRRSLLRYPRTGQSRQSAIAGALGLTQAEMLTWWAEAHR